MKSHHCDQSQGRRQKKKFKKKNLANLSHFLLKKTKMFKMKTNWKITLFYVLGLAALTKAQIENNMKGLQNMALPTLIPLPNLSSLSKNFPTLTGLLPNQQQTNGNFPQFQQSNEPMRNKEKIPCTCGVFLSGQFKRGSDQQPFGNAVLLQELPDSLVCGPIGEKQCVNKCLESIVRHLPNSGPMICGSIDRDCFKERAYLFIKNCNDAWVNSNLSAGREYCCKDGLQYKCPTGLATIVQQPH